MSKNTSDLLYNTGNVDWNAYESAMAFIETIEKIHLIDEPDTFVMESTYTLVNYFTHNWFS